MSGAGSGFHISVIVCFCVLRSNSDFNSYTCSTDDEGPVCGVVESLHTTISTAYSQLASPFEYPAHYPLVDGEEFDFLVVGAGAAGSVVAYRLSEHVGWTVLLLEAGGDPTKTSEVPAFRGALAGTNIDWRYKTEPGENNCLGMRGGRCCWTRGKVLGGSSTINYLNYIRGNAKDFDAWKDAGNPGWGYEDVLPYFMMSEDMRAEEVVESPDFKKYHGTGGSLKVESFVRDDYLKELGSILQGGMQERGYQYNPDCNGKTQTGFSPIQGMMQNGRRCSAAKAFLSPAKGRKNLKVSKQSLVSKLLMDPTNSTVYGIRLIDKNGSLITVKARKEVILSAGAINSPQLLMLSGIGPKEHLESLNIEVIADLPVGKNLQDHNMMTGLVMSLNYSKTQENTQMSMFKFLTNESSLLSNSGLSYVGFINTIQNIDYPDLEMLFAIYDKGDPFSLLNNMGYNDEIKNEFIKVNSRSFIIEFILVNLRPYSRGEILLNNTDPLNHPIIKSGYFTDVRDIDTFLRAYDFVESLSQTYSFKRFNSTFREINIPSCGKFTQRSRDYRECVLRHLSDTLYHYCGTCKMGPVDSKDSVVDPHLRVKSVHRLRVIDASVMPTVVSGHLNAAATMIGEKGADLIKDTWLNR